MISVAFLSFQHSVFTLFLMKSMVTAISVIIFSPTTVTRLQFMIVTTSMRQPHNKALSAVLERKIKVLLKLMRAC